MIGHQRFRRLVAGLVGLLAVGLVAPPATVAADGLAVAVPKPAVHFTVRITLTDQGFDQPEYTVGDSPGTNVDHGQLIFVNAGTKVHAVKSVPGALDEGASFGYRVNGLGIALACFAPLPCANVGPLDTGGIEPGGMVSLGVHPYNVPVDYKLTSATDCLMGISPDFNCAPVTIHVVNKTKRSALSGTMPGSVLRPAGSADCTGADITPDVGPAYCLSAVRTATKPEGSTKAPLGDTTVKITDFGFEPTLVYVKPGSTVTWLNDGERVHSILKKGPQAPPDGYHNLTSPGLGPGESWSYYFPAGSSVNYQSNVQSDIIPNERAGGAASMKPSGGCASAKAKGKYCGQPAMVGRIQVVD